MLGCGGNRVYLRRSAISILFCRVELGIGNVHQHIAGIGRNLVLAQIRGCINAGFPVQVCQRVISAVYQCPVCHIFLAGIDRHRRIMGLAGLGILSGTIIGGRALNICLGRSDRAGAGNRAAAGAEQNTAAQSDHLAIPGNSAVVQFDGAAAVGIQQGLSIAAIGCQNRAVSQRQGAVLDFQSRLALLRAAGIITSDEYLALDRHIAGGEHHCFIIGAVFQVAVGEVVGVGVNGRIFQNCAVRQAELSAEGRTGFKFLFVGIVVHGEGAAALDVNDALHHRIGQRQFAAVLHNNADTAENLHVDKRQIAAVRDVERLRNFARFDLLPFLVIAQIAVSTALVRAVPDLQLLRHADALGFILYITAEVFNGPRLHDVPCIQAAAFVFLQIFSFDLVCQRLLTGVNAEGQLIAVRSAALIVLYMNGDQVAACVLRRTIQRQVTAEGHVDTLHAAVSILGRVLRGIRSDVNLALFTLQIDLRRIGLQLLPIAVDRLDTLFRQCTINRNRAVLVAGSTAGAGTGYAVVILLADNSGFKAAYDFHMQLQRIALAVIFFDRSAAVCVDDQLEGQIFVAVSGNGDHIAAFQNANDRGGTKVRLCKNKAIFARVCSVSTAGGWIRRFPLPCCAIYCNLSDCRNIVMGCIPKSHIPVIAKEIFVKDNIANCNSLMYDCLERGGDGHVLTGHGKGVFVGIIFTLIDTNRAAGARYSQRVQHIVVSRSCGNCHGVACLGSGGRYCYSAVFNIGCCRYSVLSRGVLYNSSRRSTFLIYLNYNIRIISSSNRELCRVCYTGVSKNN